MSKIKFYLNRTFKNGERSIQLRTFINKSLFTYQTGCSIIPELWDKDISGPTKVKKAIRPYRKNNPHIDTDLENISIKLDNLKTALKRELLVIDTKDQKIDFGELRQVLDSKYKDVVKVVQKEKDGTLSLNEFIELHITRIENGEETYKVKGQIKKYGPSTVKVYKEWKTQFLAFQKKAKKIFDFDDITIDFYNEYVNFFIKKKYSTNSIGKQVKHLKAIMRVSLDRGLHQNKEFLNKAFQTPKTDTDSIYLSDSEVMQFYNVDLSARPHLERCRDVFLVGCWTALRYSDYSRIRPEHIKERDGIKYIEIITQKTTEKVIIPVRPELDAILNKYGYRLPKTYEQKVNTNIKLIAEELEIDEPISISTTKGGITRNKRTPKYELIKTHTARRTGATLMYKAGIPILDICKITGHRKPESLLKYIKVTKQETAKKLSLNPFFKGNQLKVS